MQLLNSQDRHTKSYPQTTSGKIIQGQTQKGNAN